MRTELDIVNLANNMIGVCGLSCEMRQIVNFDPINFFKVVGLNPKRHGACEEMTFATLGEIVALSVGPHEKTPYRQTSVGDLFPQHLPFTINWTGTDGKTILRHMAVTVVIATMYDILATQWYVKSGGYSLPYQPCPAMKRYITEHGVWQRGGVQLGR